MNTLDISNFTEKLVPIKGRPFYPLLISFKHPKSGRYTIPAKKENGKYILLCQTYNPKRAWTIEVEPENLDLYGIQEKPDDKRK